MTDSTCKRMGYDDTGKYHVPAIDQCSECRCAPGQSHHPDCETRDSSIASGLDFTVPTLMLNTDREWETPQERNGTPPCACAGPPTFDCDANCPAEREVLMDAPVPINIPWSVQQELFDLHARQALAALPGYIHLHADEIMAMAAARMECGFHEYGSRAFGWSAEERLQNLLEELADACVYIVTGPVG